MKTVASTILLASAVAASPHLNVGIDRSHVRLEPTVAPHNPKTSSWAPSNFVNKELATKQVTVSLKVDDEAQANLEEIFWKVSDPDDVNYGQHLSLEELAQVMNVPLKRVEKVKNYFLSHGATSVKVSPTKDMLTVQMPVTKLETALRTKLDKYTHKEHKKVSIVRASRPYSLPEEIASEVVMVGELLQFPALRSKDLENLKGSGTWPNSCSSQPSCSGLVQPEVIRQRYNLPNQTEYESMLGGYVNAQANSMAVAEFQGQYFSPGDNQRFTKSCHRDVQVETIIGGNSGSQPGVEASLDIEYIRGVSPEIPLTVIYSGQYSLLNWANLITSNKTSPHVHSVSYGNDEKQQSSRQYMLTCNVAFMKAGVAGKSILFASGDQGVCGREGCGIFKKRFKPDFPGGSPYITVVGGTNFHNAGIGEEEVWNDGGGGFSDNFPIPQYQASAVAAYKNNKSAKLPDQSLWNNTGRGYPDIAALAGQKTPYCVVSGGNTQGVAGTSAACPVAAGVFAKLNGVRLKANKPVLGFLNPFIYQNPQGFHDVTIGCNGCQGGIFSKKGNGFTAIAGWDAASGFGTPNFDALSKLV